MSKNAEVSRPPKGHRLSPTMEQGRPADGLYRMPVTETENMRNAGNSIVNEKLGEGWEKPTDPAMLQLSPDENKFNLVRDYDEVMAEREANNQRARRMEGFRDSDIVTSTSRTDETVSGPEVLAAAMKGAVASHDDG